MSMRMANRGVLAVMLLALTVTAVHADVRLHRLFSDNMVLQRGETIPVWGWGDEGETVSVTLNNAVQETQVDDEGEWQVEFASMEAGGPYTLEVESNDITLTRENVMVGEVWICSGQSNMEWPLSRAQDAEEEIENANHPNIRLFTVPRLVAGSPQEDVVGSWSECSPRSARSFSAVGYFFGRELYETLGVPVGLIQSTWGGTPAEAWTRMDYLEDKELYQPIMQRFMDDLEEFPDELNELEQRYTDWRMDAQVAEEDLEPVPDYPRLPNDPRRSSWRPAGLYNAMIAPLVPYAFEGAIWYQGESNASRAYQYRELFPDMIMSWRDSWSAGAFPFLYVQLANFEVGEDDQTWPELRQAQFQTLSLPNTAMAVITDVGDPIDIHPRNKQTVGKRLARAAKAVAYDYDITYMGPIYTSHTVEDESIVLSFEHVGAGLMKKGSGPLRGFEIAGSDQEFVEGQAEIISDNQVRVHSPVVEEPAAVRYGWDDDPVANLYNKTGLPASPFRTDDWGWETADNR